MSVTPYVLTIRLITVKSSIALQAASNIISSDTKKTSVPVQLSVAVGAGMSAGSIVHGMNIV